MSFWKSGYTTDETDEQFAREVLAPLAAEQPSSEGADAAQAALVTSVAAVVEPRGLGVRQRFALGAGALLMPLLAVGAVGAATGQGPLDAPVEAVSSAVGIGGNSGDQRNDYDNRAEAAGDNGQPGSCPGKACDAPGHNKTATASASGEDAEAARASKTPKAEKTPKADKTKTDPHANGKGCDDKLFASATPPFGGHDTPVGPCKDDDASATPGAASAEADEDGPGSGNGNGHDKGRGTGHEQGQGQGHDKDSAAGASPAASTPTGSTNGGGKGKPK